MRRVTPSANSPTTGSSKICRRLSRSSELQGFIGFELNGRESGVWFYVHQDFIEDGTSAQSSPRDFCHRQQAHWPDAVFRDQQRATEGRIMIGQSDQRHRRNDRSRGCGVFLFNQRVILFAIPIVADLDDAGIFAEVHTGGDSCA